MGGGFVMGAVIKRMEGIPVVYQQVIGWVEEYTRLIYQWGFRLRGGAYSISREWLDPTPSDPWYTLELNVVGPMPRLTERTPWAIEIKIREQQRGVSTEVITRCNVGDSVLDYFKELVDAMYEQWPAARVRTDYEFDEVDDPCPSSQTLDDAPDHYNLYPVQLEIVKGILADLESKWDERWATARELPGHVFRSGSSLKLEISPRLFGPHKFKEGVWMGPTPAFRHRLKKLYRYQVVLKASTRYRSVQSQGHQKLKQLIQEARKSLPSGVQMIVDVDPIQFI